jgi:peptide chain release factor subunit 1
VWDGSDTDVQLFGTLAGNTREIVHKFSVDLPKKHGRGGQSALRFSRLREEARRNYVRKVAELAVQHFITNDRVNVAGLVLAGSAELKTDLSGSDLFDPRLLAKVIKIVDVSYGGENGFNQVCLLVMLHGHADLLGHRAGCRLARQCQIRPGEEVDPKVL